MDEHETIASCGDVSTETPRLVSVVRNDVCTGFLLGRGPRGIEAFDAIEKSLGTFPDAPSAATAVERSVAPPDNVTHFIARPAAHKSAGIEMSHRRRLENRRASTNFELEVAGLHYTATV